MGWQNISWTDVKYLHRATEHGAGKGIAPLGVIPGFTDRRSKEGHEGAFLSSCSFASRDVPNSRAKLPACVFNRGKRRVDVTNDANAAHVARCESWLGAQGAIVTNQRIPQGCVLAMRDCSTGATPWPARYAPWTHPALSTSPPSSQIEYVASPDPDMT